MRILLIDEESGYLTNKLAEIEKQYVIDVAYSSDEGIYLSEINEYDAVVIDSADPKIVDYTKNIKDHAPVLVLADRGDDNFLIKSLDAGADACVYKPVNPKAVTAQLNALIRRQLSKLRTNEIQIKNIVVKMQTKQILVNKKLINFRRKEYDILEYLAINCGHLVSKEKLLEHIWEDGILVSSNTLEVHIRNIRKKLIQYKSEHLIKTIKGFGYRIDY